MIPIVTGVVSLVHEKFTELVVGFPSISEKSPGFITILTNPS